MTLIFLKYKALYLLESFPNVTENAREPPLAIFLIILYHRICKLIVLLYIYTL